MFVSLWYDWDREGVEVAHQSTNYLNNMSVNYATASWEGDLKSGNGHIKTERGSLDTPFTFASRFEGASGIGPEDLVAAAISGCFSMALSNELAGQGNVVTRVDTRSTVTLGPDPAGGFHIS